MGKLSSVDFETLLGESKCQTIAYSATKKHLGAVHEIKHYVLQIGFECEFVDLIKVDLVFSNNLYALITLLVVYLPLNMQSMD